MTELDSKKLNDEIVGFVPVSTGHCIFGEHCPHTNLGLVPTDAYLAVSHEDPTKSVFVNRDFKKLTELNGIRFVEQILKLIYQVKESGLAVREREFYIYDNETLIGLYDLAIYRANGYIVVCMRDISDILTETKHKIIYLNKKLDNLLSNGKVSNEQA